MIKNRIEKKYFSLPFDSFVSASEKKINFGKQLKFVYSL
jgi:hypothetical protein